MKTIVISALVVISLLLCPFGFTQTQQEQTINDKDVRILDFEDMPYPQPARSLHIQGSVVVRVKLNSKGGVTDATAVSGDPALVYPSITNAKKWIFEPNTSRSAVVVYYFRMLDGVCLNQTSLFVVNGNVATVLSCPTIANTSSSPASGGKSKP
jgi:TonB family protein